MSRLSILRSVSRKFFGIAGRGLSVRKGRWARASSSHCVERLEDRRVLSATPSNQFEGWANLAGGSWTGSTLQGTNSLYQEGEAIPFRFYDNQAAGSTHTIVLKYDFGSGMQQFFDALVSFDVTETGVDPALGISDAGTPALPAVDIPMDTSLPANVQANLQSLPRALTTYNIDTSSVMFGAYSLPTAGADAGKKMLTMTYTVSAGGGDKNVVIAYGLHLANSNYWGPGNGASSAAGASQKAYESLDGDADNSVSVNPNSIPQIGVSIAGTTQGSETGPTNAAFTVSLTQATSSNTVLAYSVAGTATSGSDFTPLSGTVTILAGQTTATITIPVLDDSAVEPTETVSLTLTSITSSDPGVSIITPSASRDITDNDISAVSVAVAPDNVLEDGAANLVYTFTRSNTSAETPALTINFQATGTATSGTDYAAVGTSVTFAAGSSTAKVTVDPATDTTVEPNETVILTVLSGSGYSVGNPNLATGTITDDDTSTVSVTVSPGTVMEDGAANLVYTFTRTNTTAQTPALTVNFQATGTATSGSDYATIGTTVSFAAGSSTAIVTVDPTTDSVDEPDETVILTLLTGSGYTIGNPDAATGTITDDDVSAVSVAVSPGSVAEDGAANLVYTFTRTNTSSETPTLTINFGVTGSATSGSDYDSVGTMVTFAAGSSTATVTVDPTTDAADEPNETVILAVVAGSGYTIGAPNSATGTITDDDVSAVSVTVSPGSVAENGAMNLVYTFTRTNISSESPALTVNWNTSGTATSGSDYGAVGTMVTFAAGNNTATVTVDPTDDATDEPDETVILSLGSGSGYTIGGPSAATGTITDEDISAVHVTISPALSVAEDGSANLVYTFTRTNTSAQTPALTINFQVSGTATSGSDYAAVGTTATFALGSSTATIIVDPTPDATVEPDETVILTVVSGTGYTIGNPDAATGTITDNDVSAVSVTVSPGSVVEDGVANLIYTFTRTNSSSETPALTVNFSAAGSATSGSDYAAVGTMVSFAVGSSTATVIVDPTNDSTVESAETVILTVVSGSGYTIGSPNSATGTITDDDVSTVSVTVSPDTVAEDGVANLIYTFTRTNTTAQTPALTVNFLVSGSATSGSDYGAVGTMVTFAAGSSTATVTVDPTADVSVEPDETVILTVASGNGYTIGSPNAATGTITDENISAVSVTVSPVSVAEDGVANLIYTFTRTNTSSETPALTVNFNAAGTATSGSDYAAVGSMVTFAAGSSTATVTVNPTPDAMVESAETVILTVLSGSDYSIGSPSAATGTITDDDFSTVSVSVSPISVAEDGAVNLVYTFTRTNTSAETPALVVNFQVTGSATSGSDYGAVGTMVSFAAGSSTATVTVNPTADATDEPDETVILTVASGGGYTIGSPNSATGTITDDDVSGVSVAVAPKSVAEDGSTNLIYTFTRSNTSAESPALAVNFDVAGSATSESDFAAVGTVVTFAAGSSTATVTVNPTTDATDEPDETVILTVLMGSSYSIGNPDMATGTITDDDVSAVSVSVSPASVAEDGAANLVYTFTRNNTSAETPAVTVNFQVTGTATSGIDFGAVGTTVSFAAGSSTATITVNPTVDTTDEPDETVILTALASSGYTMGTPNMATGTITDDDVSAVSVTVAPDSVAEDGVTNLVYTFTRSNTSSETPALTVNIGIGGSATSGSDYDAVGTTVSFAAGSNTATVTVAPTADEIDEPNETVILSVVAGSGYSIGSPNAATGTITDDDDSRGILVFGSDVGTKSSPAVKVFESGSNTLKFVIDPSATYGATYRRGVRVATGDINGDGVADIVTAPARYKAPDIKIFDGVDGSLIGMFRANDLAKSVKTAAKFKKGVYVAVGDVTGDGKNDIVVSQELGAPKVLVYRNTGSGYGGTSGGFAHYSSKMVFSDFRKYIGGATVAVGDVNGDGRAEVIVGSGAGMRGLVRVFDVTPTNSTTGTMTQIVPDIWNSFTGGVYAAAGDLNNDGKAEIVTGSASGTVRAGAGSKVRIYEGSTGTQISSFDAFPVVTDVPNAAVRVAVADGQIYAAQGPDGRSQYRVRVGTLDSLGNVEELDSFFAGVTDPNDPFFFGGGLFVAANHNR